MRRAVIAVTLWCTMFVGVSSGCSSSVDGSARAGSSAMSSPATATAAATAGAAASDRPDAGTGAANSTEPPLAEPSPGRTAGPTPSVNPAVPAAGLDEVSANWFTAYCHGLTEIAHYNELDTSGLTLGALTEARIAAYAGISLSASTTADILRATPPPTFTGGDDLEVSAVDRFTVVSDVYGRAALALQAAKPPTEADLQAAVAAIEQEVSASIPPSMAQVDAPVLNAAKQLPECQAVLN